MFYLTARIARNIPYGEKKRRIFELVPAGGCWRDIDPKIAKEYMKSCWDMEGGRTGILRRMSLDEPSLTVLTSPSQKQTERCHPLEARPFTIRENARCQTFSDEWEFCGKVSSQYKQVGNAVPVNLAYDIAIEIHNSLKMLEKKNNSGKRYNKMGVRFYMERGCCKKLCGALDKNPL